MIKSLTVAFLAGAAMMATAVAGPVSSGKNAKAPVMPAPACAEPISYDNVGLDWGHTWVNGGDDIDGVNFDFSKTIIQKLYFHGTTSWANSDFAEWGFTAGLGYAIPLAHNLDFVTEAGGVWANEGDSNGYYIFPHLRTKIGCLELQAGGKFIDVGDCSWEAHVNAYYEVAPHVDLHVGGIFAEDADTLQVGFRYKF